MMGKISLQPMPLVAGRIHVLRHAGYVKSSKNSTKTVGMFRLNYGFGAGLRKASLVRGGGLHSGKSRPLDADDIALPWGWMVPAPR